jgi:hypothetical protein
MSRGKASGLRLTKSDAAIVLGMVARGDRDHDIAAWFGVNQGRIAEVKDGSHGSISAAPVSVLPPKGPPGVKGKMLREAVRKVLMTLGSGTSTAAADAGLMLAEAAAEYDAHET